MAPAREAFRRSTAISKQGFDVSHPSSPQDAALVTGGTSGIGLAITLRFLAEGKRVYALSRRGASQATDLDRAVAERDLPRPVVLQGDTADMARLRTIAADLTAHGACLRIVVASAGTNVRKLALDVSDEESARVVDVNLNGVFNTFRAFAPLVMAGTDGRFIAISSINDRQGMRLRVPYSAAKAAVSGLVRGLAVEWGPLGATVNAIAPGITRTPLVDGYLADHPERGQAGLDHTPVGRFGTPDDSAFAASFLAAREAGFVNGHVLVVDGGMTAGYAWW
jgi:NAD(P)-dependent dehydrogenase (short-subunit alcohol dehydrogenase family)